MVVVQAGQVAPARVAAQLDQARAGGVVESVFWGARPILPAIVDDELKLYDWGNRDDGLKLPKTGWLRIESLEAGKWNYLRPREVAYLLPLAFLVLYLGLSPGLDFETKIMVKLPEHGWRVVSAHVSLLAGADHGRVAR